MDYQNEQSNVFNGALATLERIDFVLRQLLLDKKNGDILAIKNDLENLMDCAYPFMKQEEKLTAKTHLTLIDMGLSIDPLSGSMKAKTILYIEMRLFYWFLIEILHAKGLLMARGEDPSTAILR